MEEGSFLNDKRHGEGILTLPNNEIDEIVFGNWENDILNGYHSKIYKFRGLNFKVLCKYNNSILLTIQSAINLSKFLFILSQLGYSA
jgi:hypothetical protein